jgi:hypothetical protein
VLAARARAGGCVSGINFAATIRRRSCSNRRRIYAPIRSHPRGRRILESPGRLMDSRALLPAYRPAPNPFRFIAPAIHKFLFNLICHHCYGNRAERSAARVTHDRAPPQRLSFFRLSSMRASFRHLQADERLLPSSSPPLRRAAITRNGHFAAFAHALNAPLRRDRTIPNPFPSRRSEGSSEVEWTREGTRCHFLRIKISQICESDAFADCGSFLLPPSLSLSFSLSPSLPPSLFSFLLLRSFRLWYSLYVRRAGRAALGV